MQERIASQPAGLPRVSGKHVSKHEQRHGDAQEHYVSDMCKRREVVQDGNADLDTSCGQSVRMIDVSSEQQAACMEERRPMTAAGSSVYATAIRQLESEQRLQVPFYSPACCTQSYT